ncbi:MAG: TIGR03086 family protein [Intrasporangiaceae bacterium]|nr:TIGR03086 family protein [Intrasporangiaceae bacterium]
MSELTEATVADRHRLLAQQFIDLIDGTQDWDSQSPVPEWRAQDIVEHLAWLPSLLGSLGVDLDVAAIDSPVERFKAQTVRVQEILDGPEAGREINLPGMRRMTVTEAIDRLYNFDLYAHAWDLASATGQEHRLDEDYAVSAHQGMSAMGPALHESGQFGTPREVAEDAPASERLLGLIGRDPHWRR